MIQCDAMSQRSAGVRRYIGREEVLRVVNTYHQKRHQTMDRMSLDARYCVSSDT